MDFNSVALQLISLVAGLLGVPIVDAIKNWFKVDGKVALVIVSGVSLVLAFVSVFLSGQYTGVPFTLDSLVEASGYVFGVATLFYKLFVSDE